MKWWQMSANEIAEKHTVSDMSIGYVNNDKEEGENWNDVEQEEHIKNRRKKAKT
ncbi:hypothetical protein MKX03_032261, partial [Papaver bracteatum]